MRSRRVARQEKLMNGTLRKRKHREENDHHAATTTTTTLATVVSAQSSSTTTSSTLSAAIVKPANQPKTIVLDENGTRIRIKVNVESVNMDEIPAEFRKSNSVFPRAINMYAGARWLEESLCNELGWRLVCRQAKREEWILACWLIQEVVLILGMVESTSISW